MSETVEAARIFAVTPENALRLWPQIEPMLVKIPGLWQTHDSADVKRMVLGEQAHLWVQWRGERVEAFQITEFAFYPKCKMLRIWLAGAADGCTFDDDAFFEVINEWRIFNDCKCFEVIGRIGWLKRFPQLRFHAAVLRTFDE